MAFYANDAGLATVASQLHNASVGLMQLAATPPTHPALAADETSTTAAARLSEHGAVLASRAADAAQVLLAASRAVNEISRVSVEMDGENAKALAAVHRGPTGGVTPTFVPAVTSDVVAPDVPIAPAAPRYGKISAQIMENGHSDAGSTFSTACTRYGAMFNGSAVASRLAAQTIETEALRGNTAPVLASALRRYATWADSMQQHSSTLASAATGHRDRFGTAQNDTPRSAAFTSKERELSQAQALNARFGGAYSAVVTKLQSDLIALNTRAGVASQTYHLGELPAAPPPPPPVVPVVAPTTPEPGRAPQEGQPSSRPEGAADQSPGSNDVGDDLGAAGTTDEPLDLLGGDPALTDEQPGDPMSQAGPLVAMLPGVLAGVVGGALGALTSLPAAAAQQAQSALSQAGQAVEGLAKGLSEPEMPDLDASDLGSSSAGFGDISGGGGGPGSTEPASVSTDLPPASGGMLAQAGPASAPAALPTGPAATAATTQSGGMMGGMPMMPPMAGGMGRGGGGGSKPVAEPDKKIIVPVEPNSEFVKGEVPRRVAAEAADVTNDHRAASRSAEEADVVVTSSRRRRVEMPKDDD